MKKYLFILLPFLLLLASCSKKENTKIQLFSPSAYAFSLDDKYEVNVAVQAKQFKMEENNGQYKASVSYSIDIVKPDGAKVNNINASKIDTVFTEKVSDFKIEAQFDLDKTYKPGKYKAIITAKDNMTKTDNKSEVEFTLE